MFSSLADFIFDYSIAILLTVVFSYLIGSIDFAILVTRHYQKEDIRNCGSGNAGMTNVMRSVGKKAGIITFIGDVLKGAVAVAVGYFLFKAFAGDSPDSKYIALCGAYIAGVFDILGHMFPVYFGFKGGKGVATSIGIMLFTDWRVCLVVIVVFVITAVITKYISAGSLLGAASFFIATILFNLKAPDNPGYFIFISITASVVIGLSVIIKHHSNIKRLINGTESKFAIKGEKKK